MPFAGALAGLGKLNIVMVILAGTFGNLIGSYIAWIIGRTGGRALVLRAGRYVRIKEEDLHKAERWFARRGDSAVLIGRILPLFEPLSLSRQVQQRCPRCGLVYSPSLAHCLGVLPWLDWAMEWDLIGLSFLHTLNMPDI